ncbi:MAG: adenylate/guanylate cyclase domain-containing protein [Xanthomonadales bacterium]|nr:adenylate/guanylate cyclase domain-containing protein [Xanthomonadales bacterium]
MHQTGPAERDFQQALLRYSQEPDAGERARIEEGLWARFGATQAVLVADMSGFSMITNRHGIVHYLSMVHRMQRTAEPIVQGFGGVLVKFDADNCFAMFPQARQAIRAALALNHAFDAANRMTPDELDIRLGCGIDAGRILVLEDRDFFGEAVNRASKLGEDLAEPGEILVSDIAMQQAGADPGWHAEPQAFSISGLQWQGYRIRASDAEDEPD